MLVNVHAVWQLFGNDLGNTFLTYFLRPKNLITLTCVIILEDCSDGSWKENKQLWTIGGEIADNDFGPVIGGDSDDVRIV